MTLRRALLVLFLLPLMSCGFFSRSKSKFYSLDRIAPTAPVRALTGPPVAIDVVELPPGLDRREMIIRKSDQQLDVRGTQQWSASLEALVLHTLAFDLADRLPEGMVILPGQIKPAGATRSISLAVEALAIGPENAVTLDTRWIVNGATHHETIRMDTESLEGAAIASGV
ncbi:MAG TPA: ABC-type transport auxiliary lipoprotein family protein, partial [Thermoanaerobaculia bacterium]|nr:ABC-type transport auxiliary lipoprotein family protein [Thermoanaerobaculia bacterium]